MLKKITDKIIDAITGKSKFKSSILENATLSKIFGKFFNNLSVLKHNDSLSPQQYIEAAIQEINTSLNTAEGKSRLQLQSALYGLTQLLNTLDDKKLEGIIAERERFLGDQMLQLIAGQVDKNPHLLEGETFKMAHVGLLNGFANSLDSTGWVHDEGNEIADMAAIFQRFDGYEIILNSDVKTPSFSKGKIYLPLPAGQEGVKRMKLQTFYSNCSPQVNTSNWGTQKQVNEETLKQWQQAGQADNLPATFTKELIGAQKSSYTMAVDLEFDLIQAGFAVSTGCQSAKDRTGVVVGLLMQKLLEKANGITPDNNPHRGKVLTSDGLAIQIAGQNTGDKTLKVDPLQISTSTAREKLSLTLHSIKSFGEQVIANNVSKLWKKRPLVQKDQYPRVHPQRHFTQLSSSAGVKRVSLAAISESDEKAAQERSGA